MTSDPSSSTAPQPGKGDGTVTDADAVSATGATGAVADSTDAVRLNDREVLDDHGLRQRRLRGAMAQGGDWRHRPAPSPVRRLVYGAVLGLVALGVVAAVTFVRHQLASAPRKASSVSVVTDTGSPTVATNDSDSTSERTWAG